MSDAKHLGLTANKIAKIATNLERENAELRKLVRDFDKCLDTALYLAGSAGYLTMPDQKLFASLRQRMRELAIGGEDGAQGPDDRA